MLENKTGVGETCRLSAAAAAGDQKFCRVTRHAAMWRQNVKTKTNKNVKIEAIKKTFFWWKK